MDVKRPQAYAYGDKATSFFVQFLFLLANSFPRLHHFDVRSWVLRKFGPSVAPEQLINGRCRYRSANAALEFLFQLRNGKDACFLGLADEWCKEFNLFIKAHPR